MLEYWIVVTAGVVAIICALCGACIYNESRALRIVESRMKLKVYNDLLRAVTEMNIAGNDPYRLDQAKKQLAFTLNRANLVAGREVLSHINSLLDFLNEAQEGEYDVLRQLNILNNIVRAARREMDPNTAGSFEESQFRFRFYNPPRP